MNFSVLHFFKFATRMPQIAQILVSTFKMFRGWGWGGGGGMPPDPPRNFLFFSLAIPDSAYVAQNYGWNFSASWRNSAVWKPLNKEILILRLWNTGGCLHFSSRIPGEPLNLLLKLKDQFSAGGGGWGGFSPAPHRGLICSRTLGLTSLWGFRSFTHAEPCEPFSEACHQGFSLGTLVSCPSLLHRLMVSANKVKLK